MGASLSIVNNTPETWLCKIGPDEAALRVATIVTSAVAATAAVIGTAGMAAPAVVGLVGGGFAVTGIATTALAAIATTNAILGTGTSALSTISDFGLQIANGVNNNLKDQGYDVIAPSQSHTYEGLTHSLWQQGTCVRTVIVNERTVRTETVYMRPIFSSGIGFDGKHEIQFWLNKFGTESTDITAQSSGRSLEEEEKEVDTFWYKSHYFQNFLIDRLPPCLEDEEKNCASDNSPLLKINVNTQLKLLRHDIVRLVIEAGKAVVYHCRENSRQHHETPISPLEFELDGAESIESVLQSYPNFFCVGDLPHEDPADQIELAKALYKEGILMYQKS